ncbi:Ldh family oxidoreductase [Ramlibacter sp. XY19]|uniref:Ldh family oxidoreductase n=1 Tax=Ramlibacter paludis TaxID=2908000 RepID=UPI0023DAA8D2|nr:Ldh family oxidoreductase [Ramlibacter paludis]MCG2594211.1 Ldh family oxidoreductase [Ramlibacter paludis]
MPESRIPAAQLRRFMTRALERLGLPAADAATVGEFMTEAELQGSDGHGAIRLAPYARRIRAGGINLTPAIRIEKEKAGMALLDGDNGMGHLVMKQAAEIAIAKARNCGVAWVGARLSNHAGPASLYARMALEHDMIGVYFAVGNANHLPPWGGLDMLLSTNPIAVAVPAGEEPAVVLDMATTVAAYGKVKAKAQRGEQMPVGWMIDRTGAPLTDPKRSEEGFLMPIGGYKGYGLALVVGLLAGTLNGAAMGSETIDFNKDQSSVTNTGQAILMIDPDAFGDLAAFKARVDKLVREMRASERMPGVDRIWLPGEQSHARRVANLRDGMALPPTLVAQLDALARELGIPLLQET